MKRAILPSYCIVGRLTQIIIIIVIITAIRLTWCKCKSTTRPRYST